MAFSLRYHFPAFPPSASLSCLCQSRVSSSFSLDVPSEALSASAKRISRVREVLDRFFLTIRNSLFSYVVRSSCVISTRLQSWYDLHPFSYSSDAPNASSAGRQPSVSIVDRRARSGKLTFQNTPRKMPAPG